MEQVEQAVVREVRGVRARDQRDEPALVAAVVEEDSLLAVRPGELAALVAVADRDREADLLGVDRAAPSRETRPWTSEPSIVKNRRPELSIGEEYVPSAATEP